MKDPRAPYRSQARGGTLHGGRRGPGRELRHSRDAPAGSPHCPCVQNMWDLTRRLVVDLGRVTADR
jgi:hypothetical protein